MRTLNQGETRGGLERLIVNREAVRDLVNETPSQGESHFKVFWPGSDILQESDRGAESSTPAGLRHGTRRAPYEMVAWHTGAYIRADSCYKHIILACSCLEIFKISFLKGVLMGN